MTVSCPPASAGQANTLYNDSLSNGTDYFKHTRVPGQDFKYFVTDKRRSASADSQAVVDFHKQESKRDRRFDHRKSLRYHTRGTSPVGARLPPGSALTRASPRIGPPALARVRVDGVANHPLAPHHVP